MLHARRLTAVVGLALLTASCSTTTLIKSEPPGATVKEKGNTLGTTPYAYRSSDWIWESRTLDLELSGYQNQSVLVKRSAINVPVAIGAAALFLFTSGVCFWASIPLFLAGGMDYPAEHFVTMTPVRGRAPAPAPDPALPPKDEGYGY